MGRVVRPSGMRITRLLALFVIAAASTLGGCYVDSGPPPPGYYYGHPHAYGHPYEWHAYGRVNVR